MEARLTNLIALDADQATKLVILEDMLAEPPETPSSQEILALFWISVLSLSSNNLVEYEIGVKLCRYFERVPYSKEFWSHLGPETLDEYFRQSMTLNGGHGSLKAPRWSALLGIREMMASKKRVRPEGVKVLWVKVGQWISSFVGVGLSHEQFVSVLEVMHAAGIPIVKCEALYKTLMAWIMKTPLKPSTFNISSLEAREVAKEPHEISQSFAESLEWVLRLFKLATCSKSFSALIVDEVLGILLNADSLVSPLFPIFLPAVSPELEQKALQISDNVIFKVLPIILNWPITNQVADWTNLLILRLRYLVTHQQSSKTDYQRQLTKWLTMIETAIDVLCKNLFHRQTRSGSIRLLSVLFNSLQRSPKPFLRSLPMLFEAIRQYCEESNTAKALKLPISKQNPLDIPLGISSALSYIRILEMDDVCRNLEDLSQIPYSTSSKPEKADSELETTKIALAKLLLIQMHCHKGQPETYIPIYEFLQKSVCIDSSGKPYELISVQEIETHLRGDSWALVSLNTSSRDSISSLNPLRSPQTSKSSSLTDNGDDDDLLEFSAFGDYEVIARSEKWKQLGLCGLVNLGNTCYMNSVLQILYQTIAFRKAVFSGTSSISSTSIPAKLTSNSPLLREMQYTFASMLHTTRNAFAPRNLLAALPDWVKGGRQHDASELEKAIFDILDTYWLQELKERPNVKTPIQNIFGGQVCSSIRCKSCGNVSERSDTLLDLSLTFPGESVLKKEEKSMNEASNSSLSLDTLIEHYLKPETMEGSDQYRCDRCDRLVDAEKVFRIETAPDHLIVNLVRFRYEFKTQIRSKILSVVDFSEQLLLPVRKPRFPAESPPRCVMDIDPTKTISNGELDVTSQVDANQASLSPEALWQSNFDFSHVPYTLYGCVMHSGKSTEYGHYYSYARSSELRPTGELDAKLQPKLSLGDWYRFNDENVDSSSFESFSRISKHFASDVAYILVFKRDETSGVASTPSEAINIIPEGIMKRVEDDNAKAEIERKNKKKSIRPTRQALLDTRSRFDEPPSNGGSGSRFGGPDMGFGGGFGGGWVS